MEYLLLWLVLGCIGYMLALAVQLERAFKEISGIKKDKDKIQHDMISYVRGLLGILFGPLTIAVVFLFMKIDGYRWKNK